MRRVAPGVALLFLAPVLGELVSGHQTPLQFLNPIVFLAMALPYGCGALLCREATRRWNKGWLSLLLLGIAYALYEEGIVSRALFDPQWTELGALGPYNHVAGINWTYGFILIHFHLTVSIAASVLLAEVLYHDRRREPWLTPGQMALCALVLALWAPVLVLLARADHPLLVPSPALWAGTAVGITALVIAARSAPARPVHVIARTVPPPHRFLILGAANTTIVFVIVFLLPEHGLLPPLALTVIALLAIDAASLALLLRWSGNARAWDDRHRVALVAGVLAFFVVFGVLSDLERFEGKSLVGLGAAVGVWWVSRSVAKRARDENEART
jgi:hypothetical protein